MKTAIVYVAGGSSYCYDAEISCNSFKLHNPEIPCILATDERYSIPPVYDRVVPMPNRKYPQEKWYIDSTRFCVVAFNLLRHEYDSLLFLDTDTFCDASIMDMLRLMERFDIAVSHGVNRHTTGKFHDIPNAFPEHEIGVMLVRTTDKIKHLFERWLELYESHQDIYGNNDQGPLRDAIWEDKDINMYVLPEEYHARWGFGVCVVSTVRILHSRSPGYPNSQAAFEINSTGGRRLFRPGGIVWKAGIPDT